MSFNSLVCRPRQDKQISHWLLRSAINVSRAMKWLFPLKIHDFHDLSNSTDTIEFSQEKKNYGFSMWSYSIQYFCSDEEDFHTRGPNKLRCWHNCRNWSSERTERWRFKSERLSIAAMLDNANFRSCCGNNFHTTLLLWRRLVSIEQIIMKKNMSDSVCVCLCTWSRCIFL